MADAHRKALACDPVSAFGGVVATNRPVTVAMAEQVAEVFTEVLAAPAYEPGALEVLMRKKAIRLLQVEGYGSGLSVRQVCGGMLLQTRRRAGRAGRLAGRLDGSRPATRRTTRPWPTWSSPGGPAVR